MKKLIIIIAAILVIAGAWSAPTTASSPCMNR